MKRTYTLLFLVCALFMTGCTETKNTADEDQQKKTEEMMEELNREVGLPNIINFQQKKMMKTIYELCDREDLICYAYIKSDYQGELKFIGKCMGYGIPFSAQYTNPDKIIKKSYGSGRSYITVPQPDPNGLFMPTSSAATWLMMIDPTTNNPRVAYIEPELVIVPFPLHKDD